MKWKRRYCPAQFRHPRILSAQCWEDVNGEIVVVVCKEVGGLHVAARFKRRAPTPDTLEEIIREFWKGDERPMIRSGAYDQQSWHMFDKNHPDVSNKR